MRREVTRCQAGLLLEKRIVSTPDNIQERHDRKPRGDVNHPIDRDNRSEAVMPRLSLLCHYSHPCLRGDTLACAARYLAPHMCLCCKLACIVKLRASHAGAVYLPHARRILTIFRSYGLKYVSFCILQDPITSEKPRF